MKQNKATKAANKATMEPTNKQGKQQGKGNGGQKGLRQAPAKPGGKRGPKKGSKISATITLENWGLACQQFRSLKSKMSQVAFLRSPISGELFDGGPSQCVTFGQRLREFDEGKLESHSTRVDD